MKINRLRTPKAAVTLVAALLLSLASAQQVRAVLPPGDSVAGAAGVAVASALSELTDLQMGVSHVAGPQQIFPIMEDERGAITVANAQDAFQAYNGVKPNYQEAYPSVRLLAVAYQNIVSIAVRENSDIRTAEDIRGKRVTGNFSAHRTCYDLASAQLANLGLTWDDVQVVPVTHSRDVPGALAQNIADVGLCAAPNQGAFQEADARVDFRIISADPSEEAQARTDEFYQGLSATAFEGGSLTALDEDGYVFTYDFYLLAGDHVSDDVAYEITKATFENEEAFESRYARWQTEFAERMTVPYHPGAIRYYQEAGLWSDALQARQDELLGQ